MFKLALKRLFYTRLSSGMTLLSIVLSFLVFLTLNSSLEGYRQRITARAVGPLLVAGSSGSGVDLIMKALYFRNTETGFLKNTYSDPFSEHAVIAPLFTEYTASGFPLSGTSLTYFELRHLELASGFVFTKLGDCVIGAVVAAKMQLKVGDAIISDPQNVFNPAGSVAVKMRITGILKETSSPDDHVVFTSLNTAWTVHGLGHAHPEELDKPDLSRSFIEINEETMKTFHFHGNQDDYPLSAVLLKAKSAQDEAFLLGKASVSGDIVILNPRDGLQSFLKMLFQLDSLFFIILILVLVIIVTLLLLVLFLNLKLRRQEKTLFDRLGTERMFFARLVAAEWIILICSGIVLGLALNFVLSPLFQHLFTVIMRG
jgi:putative ABC transport system permease protein